MSVPSGMNVTYSSAGRAMPKEGANKEHAPLIGSHDTPPAAPPEHRLWTRGEDEAGMSEVHPLAAEGGRDVTRAFSHAIALIARPVREDNVADAPCSGERYQAPQAR